jgi:hypothetical protein
MKYKQYTASYGDKVQLIPFHQFQAHQADELLGTGPTTLTSDGLESVMANKLMEHWNISGVIKYALVSSKISKPVQPKKQ